ncbi:hypothetical protein SERLA73DRAFT_182505 [Serpula lacrymans var. lacrymans S7.3]|uniref:Uncharacterized protein n=2 Tax=Serpula lacrymans var. lacrymans TaxID=341189 RepID=F8Q097_SERL3|nr:uncharacterized protein SERLADRAFT_469189 [Serpula lacrymans var. lacrymans S7.9]EGN97764.1 hypothetical protein SERLA73DRAFT_182505 [Serpula lacrymans var. lacrymans S7.3]EGO23357.1 hypothetical protein SERLADRAFT_469189 [Serpula lacrymans var. lacrymans S7.9]
MIQQWVLPTRCIVLIAFHDQYLQSLESGLRCELIRWARWIADSPDETCMVVSQNGSMQTSWMLCGTRCITSTASLD